MSGLDVFGNEIPTGRKLTTWEPYNRITGVYSWNRTSNLNGSDGDDYLGFLIQSGTPNIDTNPGSPTYNKDLNKINKRLIILNAGEDPGEQGGHRVLYHMVDELLSNSTLARQLLVQFSFIYIPFFAQAAIRDGRSRFGWDKQIDSNKNGGSNIGRWVCKTIIENWLSDHPRPYPDVGNNWSGGVFAGFSLHSDYFNSQLTGTNRTGTGAVPGTPYGSVLFPDGVANTSIARFTTPVGRDGFVAKEWSEYFKALGVGVLTEANGSVMAQEIQPYGGQGFYFELPWRSPGHKASHWWDEDDLNQTAKATLQGINALVIELYGGIADDLVGNAQISIVTGTTQRSGSILNLVGTAAIGAGVGGKNIYGSATNLTSTSTISASAGIATFKGVANTLSGISALTAPIATGQHANFALNLTGSAILAVARGSIFEILGCPATDLTGIAALAVVVGRKTTAQVALNLAANATLTNIIAKKSISRSALTLISGTTLSFISGLAEHKGSALSLLGVIDIGLVVGYPPGRIFPLVAQVVMSLGEGFDSKYGVATDLYSDVIIWVARGWGISRKYHGLKVSDVLKRSKIKVHGG